MGSLCLCGVLLLSVFWRSYNLLALCTAIICARLRLLEKAMRTACALHLFIITINFRKVYFYDYIEQSKEQSKEIMFHKWSNIP